MVGSRTVRRPQAADAAVLLLAPDGGKAPSRSRSTATAGGWPATPTRARSRRCSSARRTWPASGAEPLGLTNCLNFGNPEKPHIAWQLTRAVEGLRDACLALGVPVVGGNVSLYNEGGGGADLPDADRRHGRRAARRRRACRSAGFAAGGPRDRAGRGRSRRRSRARSWTSCAARAAPMLPALDLAAHAERARRRARGRAHAASLRTAHDVSEGGLACALAECCIAGGLGAAVDLARARARGHGWHTALFGEGPGGVRGRGPAGGHERAAGRDPAGRVGRHRLRIEGVSSSTSARALRRCDPGCLAERAGVARPRAGRRCRRARGGAARGPWSTAWSAELDPRR